MHKKVLFKFSIKDFFSKCDQIHSFLRIGSHLLKKFLMEHFIFLCSVWSYEIPSVRLSVKVHFFVCQVCIRIFWFFAQCMVSSNSKSDGALYFVEKSCSGVFWPKRSQKAPKMKFFKFHEELRLRVRINKKECIAVLQRERSELEPAAGTKIFAIRFLQHIKFVVG